MEKSIKKGLGFGLTSGIITTLGLMIGLSASTNEKSIVLVGILTIAIADALSDSFGVHMLEEASHSTDRQIKFSTIYTFIFKFIFAFTFAIPVFFLNLKWAIVVDIVWGLVLLIMFSYFIAKSRKVSVPKTIFEHIGITLLVIISTYFIGKFLERYI